MDKTLQMVFQNKSGKNVSINLQYVRENITPEEVKTLMELIVSKNIFDSKGGDLVSLMEANITSRETQELQVR